MDANQIRQLKPKLMRFLSRFDNCFDRKDTRAHLPVYVQGQLSELERKSVEPIALKAGVPVRTLQEFLSQHRWQEDRARIRLHELVATEHASSRSIGIIDETSHVKKGNQTPGVQRQHCGTIGKHENCIVTVHLGYATDDFHCLLDGELFLPESWSTDRERCQAAGLPDDMVYRPKTEIALELYDRARENGVHFEWLTFDEWYGVKPQFLRALDQRDQKFAGEVHKRFVAWVEPPQVTTRRYRRRHKRRLVAGSRAAQTVEDLVKRHPGLRDQQWQRWRIKDSQKGPVVWETKHVMIYPKDADGLPDKPYHLVVARNALNHEEIKYFISNAPARTSVKRLLLVAFSRWRIERCFEDDKGEIGLSHYEGRRYLGLKRHMILSAISFLFLARMREELKGEKSGAYDMSSSHSDCSSSALLVDERPLHASST
ncbi:MAG: IS701 family transposase [Pirellulales bacterium]|nr:IS701 family transposase [Pirellulales bacterium]